MDHPAELPTVLSLCTGYGGIERGLELAGYQHRTVAHVEIEAFAAANLVAKMEAGQLVPAPVWSDLKTLPAHCFRDRVDVLTGGYPCQPFSAAGLRKGADDPRHLWPYIYDHIRTIRPVRCFFENVEGHISLGLRDVIADLESLGYQTTWGIFSASEVGAPHQRKRVYILAYATSAGSSPREHANFQEDAKEKGAGVQPELKRFSADVADADSAGQQPSEWQSKSPEARHNAGRGSKAMADADSQRQRGRAETAGWQAGPGAKGSAGTNVSDADGQRRRGRHAERQHAEDAGQSPSGTGHDPSGVGSWATEPDVGRVAHGAAFRVDRLRLLGNGVVPQTAAKAWVVLNDQLTNERA
nr:site-specific DNA methylase [uncultured Mediterranean phage uvMED]